MEASQSEPNLHAAAPAKSGADKFGTRSHRCNARPINPFEEPENDAQELISEVFESSGWKRDGSSSCKNHSKIMDSLKEKGQESPYVTAIDEESGLQAVHACAINGYFELLKAFMEHGKVDPLQSANGLGKKISWVKRQCGAGVDCLWLAKR